jgi:DNA-binding beta-propeller fold protein YncE
VYEGETEAGDSHGNRVGVEVRKAATVAVLLVILIAGLAIASYRLSYPSNNSSSHSSFSSSSTGTQDNFTLIPTDSMSLPNVGQRFDHLAIDVQNQLVFITARGNNSVYVANLITEGVGHIITGLNEPQGVFYVPQNNRLYVSNGGDGTVDVFDVGNYSLVKTLSFSQNAADADNIRYDSNTGLLYVGYGEESQSGIGIIDTSSNTVVGSIHLNGHPEAFQLEQNGTRIFVNVPTANSIEVADRVTRAVIATWPISNATENFPMALDEKDHRLFVGVWSPPALFVYDTSTGKVVTSVKTPLDDDDLFYDSNTHLIFASCGQGSLFVISQHNENSYQPTMTLPTGTLARTSLFYPQGEKLYVAVPQQNGLTALLLTFSMLR